MYHAGLITQLWTAALMHNSYEWIALSSGGCRNDRVSTPLISVLTGGHSSMSALRPGSFVRRSWFCWTAHPDRLGQLHGSGDVDCQMLIREHTSSISMTAPSDAGTWRRIEWVYTLFVGGPATSVGRHEESKWCGRTSASWQSVVLRSSIQTGVVVGGRRRRVSQLLASIVQNVEHSLLLLVTYATD